MEETFEINKRIIKILNHYNLNKRQLALKVSVTPQTIGDIVNLKTNVGKIVINQILQAFSDINSDWLISGIGEMHKNSPVILKNKTGLPLIPVEAVAGFILGIDNGGVIQLNCDHYVVPEFDRLGAEFLIRVSGSSMYPKYSNGDVLACRKLKEIVFFQWGKVYVLDTSQGAVIKRLYEDPNPDFVICSSDNKENYPAFSIPKSDIRSLSIVLGVIRIE